MDIPFTKINLSMFMTYIMILPTTGNLVQYHGKTPMINFINELNKLLGAITFNTSASIVLSYESVRLLYPRAYVHLKRKTMERHNISGPMFEFSDFVIHVFPLLYLINIRKHWFPYSQKIVSVMLSTFIHGMWVRYVPKDFNLNRIYLYGADNILSDNEWLSLWCLACVGHTMLYFGPRKKTLFKLIILLNIINGTWKKIVKILLNQKNIWTNYHHLYLHAIRQGLMN